MSFLHDSTPGLNGQNSPSTTVSPFEIPTVKQLGGSPVLSHYGRLTAIMFAPCDIFVNLEKPCIVEDGYEIEFKNPTDLHLHLKGYAAVWDIGLVVHEVQSQPVQLAQADASNGQNSPVLTPEELLESQKTIEACNNLLDLLGDMEEGEFERVFGGQTFGIIEICPQPVQLAQADASKYSVMDYPNPPYLEQLLEIRGLLEQIDEAQLCEKCMAVLAPVLLKSHEIVSVSVNEKEHKNEQK